MGRKVRLQINFIEQRRLLRNVHVERCNHKVDYQWLVHHLVAILDEIQTFAIACLWTYSTMALPSGSLNANKHHVILH
jgi:hypothetical protein